MLAPGSGFERLSPSEGVPQTHNPGTGRGERGEQGGGRERGSAAHETDSPHRLEEFIGKKRSYLPTQKTGKCGTSSTSVSQCAHTAHLQL